jgi:tetratricopeptide (TPR) repeat protein
VATPSAVNAVSVAAPAPAPAASATATAGLVATDSTAAAQDTWREQARANPLFNRRTLIWLAVLGIVAVLGYVVERNVRVTVGPRSKSVAVMPFEVSGQDPALGLGLSESIAARLLQSYNKRSLELVSPREVRDVGIKTASEARQRLKTDYVLEGTVEKNGTQVRVTCTLVDAQSLRTIEARTVDGDAGDLFALQDKVIAETLSILPGGAAPETKAASVIVQPPAYESYLRGRGYLLDYQKLDNIENAISDFTHSLELEPGFAPAHAGLGQAYWIGYDSFNKGKEWLDRSQSECRKAVELDSSLAEAHACMGNYYNAIGEYQGAAQEFHSSVDLDGNNLNAWRGLGRANDHLSNPAEAETAFQKAIEVSPHYWAPYNWLGVFYYRHGRYAEAARMYRAALDRAPDNQRLYYNLAGLYEETGEYGEAIQVLQSSLQKGPSAAAYNNLGVAYFYQHDFKQAADNFRKAASLDDQGWDYWGNLGDALYWSPDNRREAAKPYGTALRLVQAKLIVNANDATAAAYVGYYCAMLDDRRTSLVQIHHALELAGDNRDVLFRAAQTYNRLGGRTETLDNLKRALDRGYSRTIVRDSPDFAFLRSDPAFAALISGNSR